MLELITTYIFNVIFIALLFVLTSTQTFVSVTTTNTKSASIHVEGTAKQHRRHLLNLATYLFVFTRKENMNNVQYVFLRHLLISLYSSNLFCFCFSSRFLRSHTLPSVGQPGNLRTYTNAPLTQNDWTLLRFPSPSLGSCDRISFQTLLFVSCFCCRLFFLLNAGTYSGVHFPFLPFL